MTDKSVPWSAILTRQQLPALALVCLGVWLHAADGLVVATMLPSIVAEIGGQALVSWSVALYEVGTIIAGTTGALLTIRFGLRLPMATTAFLFAIGCLISALSPTMPILLASRLLQGIGGGGLMALAFIAVSRIFSENLIPRAIAAMSALWGASSFLGPLIGGLFVEYANWRAGFLFFSAQALVLALWIGFAPSLRSLKREPDLGPQISRMPVARLGLLTSGVVLIAYAGIASSPVATMLYAGAGLIALAAFLFVEARAGDNRLLPRRPFGVSTPPSSALTMILFLAAATVPFAVFGPILMIALHGISVLTAGYVVAASSVSWTVFAIAVSGCNARHDPFFIGTGVALVVISIVGLAYSVSGGPLWLIVISTLLEGGGFGMAWTFILRRATHMAPYDDLERISGAMPTAQRLGFAIGAAYIGIVANAAGFGTAESTEEMSHAAVWIFAACIPPGLAGLYAAVAFLMPRRRTYLPVSLRRSRP